MEYEDIYSRFFSKCRDKSLLKTTQEDTYLILLDYLHDALSEVYIQSIFSELNYDDDSMSIEYSLVNSINEKSDSNFVGDVLSRGMVISWMRQKIDSDINLAKSIGGKEEKVLINDYKSNMNRLATLEIQLKKKIRDYGYKNGEINGA